MYQVALLLGQSLANPYEVYRLRFPIACLRHAGDANDENKVDACTTSGGALEVREERAIIAALLQSHLAQSFRQANDLGIAV